VGPGEEAGRRIKGGEGEQERGGNLEDRNRREPIVNWAGLAERKPICEMGKKPLLENVVKLLGGKKFIVRGELKRVEGVIGTWGGVRMGNGNY